jgi:uncharacterized RDD family membrane protein YckC
MEPAPQAFGWVLPVDVPARPAEGYEYAGFWRRWAAYTIDSLILGLPSWFVLVPLVQNTLSTIRASDVFVPGAWTYDYVTETYVATPATIVALGNLWNTIVQPFELFFVVCAVLQILYFALFWSRRGASLGQQLMGVEVRNAATGRWIGFRRGCVRAFGYHVSAFLLDLGFLWMALDSRKQGWHDKMAGTVVIKRTSRTAAPRWLAILVIGMLVVSVSGAALIVHSVSAQLPSTFQAPIPAENQPPTGTIWFGNQYDQTSFALAGRSTTFKRGDSIAFVATLSRTMHDLDPLTVHAISGGTDVIIDRIQFRGASYILGGILPGSAFNTPGPVNVVVRDGSEATLATGTITVQ